MFKCLTLLSIIWMTVSQVAYCQEERFSVLAESDLVSPIAGKFKNNPVYPEMIQIDNNKADAFFIARTEITVYQFRKFCESTQRAMPKRMPSWGWRENHPMVYISQIDAEDYCKWLSRETGHYYRLPTIKEWELAALGGDIYVVSNERYNTASMAWYQNASSQNTTKTVATKQPNKLGLYDMQGNVWEWCMGGDTGLKRPIKGGSWNRRKEALNILNTEFVHPETKAYNIGFRPLVIYK